MVHLISAMNATIDGETYFVYYVWLGYYDTINGVMYQKVYTRSIGPPLSSSISVNIMTDEVNVYITVIEGSDTYIYVADIGEVYINYVHTIVEAPIIVENGIRYQSQIAKYFDYIGDNIAYVIRIHDIYIIDYSTHNTYTGAYCYSKGWYIESIMRQGSYDNVDPYFLTSSNEMRGLWLTSAW